MNTTKSIEDSSNKLTTWTAPFIIGTVSGIVLTTVCFVISPSISGRIIHMNPSYNASQSEKPAGASMANIGGAGSSACNAATSSLSGERGGMSKTYTASMDFFRSVVYEGKASLNELTADDFDLALNGLVWVRDSIIPDIKKSFEKEIQKNRKEISLIPSGISLPVINGQFEYTSTGASLTLKSEYVNTYDAIWKAGDSDDAQEVKAKILASRESLKNAINELYSGKVPADPIGLLYYGKDGKIVTEILTIKAFPNGNFGIVRAIVNTSNSTLVPTGSSNFDPNARVKTLINGLNKEADRIDRNNSWEMVDGLTNQAVDLIDSTLAVQNTSGMSKDQIDFYIKSRFALLDKLREHTKSLPKGHRKDLFQNAVDRIAQMMTID